MKKIFLVSVALLMCGLMIIACAPEKRSKKNKSTITVDVEPTAVTLDNGDTQEFTAIIRNKGVVVDGDIFWRADPENFGTFSSSTSKTTIFTAAADTSIKGNGQIIAECSGIKGYANIALGTGTVIIDNIVMSGNPPSLGSGEYADLSAVARSGNTAVDPQPTISWAIAPTNLGTLSAATGATVRFTASTVNSGSVTVTASYASVKNEKQIYIGAPAPVEDKLLIYSDAGLGSLIDDIYHWDPGAGGSVTDMNEKNGGGAPGDTASYQNIEYNGQGWTEWAFVFDGTQDLSEYNTMVIYMRSSTPNAAVRIQFMEDNAVLAAENTGVGSWPALSSNWYEYRLDISGVVDKTNILNPVAICLSNSIGVFNGSFDIDYIYFEK